MGLEKCIGVLPGQYFDTESNLHYNYHRYYDPSLGRYISPDPIGLGGGINVYVYSRDNPANYTDPKGLIADAGVISIPSAAIIGAGAVVIGAAVYAIVPPEQKRAMANDVGRLWNWLWNEKTEDGEKCEGKSDLGKSWDDFNKNPDDWEKVDEKNDPDQPTDGYSRREKWRNKKSGDEIGVHHKKPTRKTGKGKPQHPHPFPPERF